MAKKDLNNQNILHPEIFFERKISAIPKKMPKDPLTEKEKEEIFNKVYRKCESAYVARILASGQITALDDMKDIKHEAWELTHYLLSRFDKARFKGHIGTENIEGRKNKKTLAWYFMAYFQFEVNNFAKANNREKRRLGMIGETENSFADIEESEEINCPDRSFKSGLYEVLMRELESQPDEVKLLMRLRFVEGHKTNELKRKFPNYNKINGILLMMINKIKTENNDLLIEELGVNRKIKRA